MTWSQRTLPTIRGLFVPLLAALGLASPFSSGAAPRVPGTNPIARDVFTADPAPLVVGNTVYLYTGHDQARGKEMFTMWDWLCFSSKDMKIWTPHGPVMRVTDFKWASRDAWASQAIERNGRFYFYAAVRHDATHPGMAIGVAVSDKPTGPFVDARGSALVTDDMTPSPYPWDDIDPTVFIDDDGTAWLAWGNPTCYLAKLKPDMTELDGPIRRIAVPNYTEGPWLSKHDGTYYLTYAAFAHQGFWEKICNATAPKITGPWTYRGILTGSAKNSYTIHPGIIDDFKGQSYFFYHYAGLTLPDGQSGGLGRRAVCIEYLYYNPDGTIQPITQTEAGVSVPPHPAPYVRPTPVDLGTTSPGVVVEPTSDFYPVNWPGRPALATVENPFWQTPDPTSLNGGSGATSIAQTFVPHVDIRLGRIALYAGDGFGTSPATPLKLALYDLGPATSAADAPSYTPDRDLLGEGSGLSFACGVLAPGILNIDFTGSGHVLLKAGHCYALELIGSRGSAPLFWRQSRTDVYSEGSAYRDHALARGPKGSPTDFALALYPAR